MKIYRQVVKVTCRKMAHRMWLIFCVVVALCQYYVFSELDSLCCPEPCKCSGDCVNVSCVGKGLTDIPRLPLATLRLNMSRNKLQRLKVINNTRLVRLDLSNNSISIVDGLNELSSLTYLNLSNNTLKSLTAFSNQHLRELDVSKNLISKIEPELLEKLVNLTYLNLSGNRLRRLTTFHNTTLRKLDVSYNLISIIEPECFKKLSRLTVLDLSGNKLGGNTNLSLMEYPKSLRRLYLQTINLENVSHELVDTLSNTSIKILSFKNNSIETFTGSDVFPHLPHLQTLDLSFNKLKEFTMSQSKRLEYLRLSNNKLENVPNLGKSHQNYAPNLKELSLANNYIRTVKMNHSKSLEFLSFSSNQMADLPICCDNNLTLLPQLKNLFVDDNCIRELKMERVNCLSKLTLFNISATKVDTIESNAFSQLTSLETLVMEYLQNLQSLEPHAFNSYSLRRLFIRGNHFIFRSSNVKKIFNNCTNLTNLDLSSNNMVRLNHRDWDFVKHMKNLTYLDISDNSILYLPEAIPKYLKRLRTFHFKANDAWKIPAYYFHATEFIESLLMNNNKFSVIHRNQLPKNLKKLKKVNLSFNSFECNCDLQWFISFARKMASKGRMYRYPHDYNCGDLSNMSIDNARISPHGCLLRQEINMIIKCTCLSVIFLLILFSIVYRYRWRLRYFIYILSYHRRKYAQPIPMPYDVYVSCSEKDFEFVCDHIVDKMERCGLQIYFPERDALPGSSKVQSTLDTIDTSRFILVCLSDSYAQNHWCEFEASMAIERSVCESRGTLIVIVLEEICSLNVTKVVNRLMRDYIKWDVDNETNNTDNWTRLLNQIAGERPDVVIS